MAWFRKKAKGRSENSHELTEEDRKHGLEIRKLNAEIKRQQKINELEELKYELEVAREERYGHHDYGDTPEEPSVDGMFNNILMAFLMKQMNPQSSNNNLAPPPTALPSSAEPHASAVGQDLSFLDMQNIWQSLPRKVKKNLKSSSNEDIKRFLDSNAPEISEKSKKEAIEFIKAQ